jgi:flagellar assembly factor FliW
VKLVTKAYGLIDVDERQKITFPEGLLGFEQIKDYVLLDAERQPFYWLQAIAVEELAFIMINPFLFRPDYEVNVDDGELQEIGLSDPKMALTFSVVTIPAEGPMTANLQGPLIINRESRLGKQAILTDSRWKTKHNVMEELASVKRIDAAKKDPC